MKIIGKPLHQWDLGRQLEITPLQGTRIDSVHFSHSGDSVALVVTPKEENGILIADIPNILLQEGRTLIAYAVKVSADHVETLQACVFAVRGRAKPADYVYTETEVWSYQALDARMKAIEENLEELVASGVADYLKENPIDGIQFETDETLILKDGILSVNTEKINAISDEEIAQLHSFMQ